MIRNVSDLLRAFADAEKKKLDAVKIKHAPTIGAMYEGLSRDILSKVIPDIYGLKIVEGFTYHGDMESGQMDCMLVVGEGEKIPYTSAYRWHISNVIAVLEIKKSLDRASIVDSHFHLKKLIEIYHNYLNANHGNQFDIDYPRYVFSQICGIIPPAHEKVETLPFDLEMIYHILMLDSVSPIRIVIGYNGWKREATLRDNFFKFIEDRVSSPRGLGAGSFPHLIICGNYSLVKATGYPHLAPLRRGMWPLMFSARCNPLILLLEQIWSRLERRFNVAFPWGDDLTQERLAPLLLAKAHKGELLGWEYEMPNIKERDLRELGDFVSWHPTSLTAAQFAIINRLCVEQIIDTKSEAFVEFSKGEGGEENFIRSLVRTGLVACDGTLIKLTTIQCRTAITPFGYFAAEDNDEKMTRWLSNIKADMAPPNNQKVLARRD